MHPEDGMQILGVMSQCFEQTCSLGIAGDGHLLIPSFDFVSSANVYFESIAFLGDLDAGLISLKLNQVALGRGNETRFSESLEKFQARDPWLIGPVLGFEPSVDLIVGELGPRPHECTGELGFQNLTLIVD